MAYQIYEDEMAKDSGLPYWMTRSLDPDIHIIVEESVDQASAALGEWDHKESKRKEPRFGVSRYAVAVNAIGERIEYGGVIRQRFREAAASHLGEEREGQISTEEIDGKMYATPPED